MREPHFGHAGHGLAVHRRSVDHLPEHSAYARFNKRLAVTVTDKIGSMTCAWVFSVIALASLPAVLTEAFHLHVFPSWLVSAGLIALVAWVAQTYIQLVLLSVIMVGQRVGAEAGDARAAKTFEDVESVRGDLTTALDRLDEKTEGGIKAVLDAVAAMRATPQAVQMSSAITLDGDPDQATGSRNPGERPRLAWSRPRRRQLSGSRLRRNAARPRASERLLLPLRLASAR